MANKFIIFLVIVVVLGGLVFFYGGREASAPADDGGEAVSATPAGDAPVGEMIVEDVTEAESGNVVVTYTDDGFSPETVTVAAGSAVVFKNESPRDFWPASAMHPTHKIYPGSDIAKCGTEEAGTIFDACGDVGPGGEWQFTFSEKGTWKHHDHLNPSKTGTIVVE